MNHRNQPDPRELADAKRQLERAGLGDLADDTAELAEVRQLLPAVDVAHGRWIGRTSGPDVFVPGPCGQRGCVLCEQDPARPLDTPSGALATAIMRELVDAGRRCAACGATGCRGVYAVDMCPQWQAAEQRNARGEWLPTRPGQVFELQGGPVGDLPQLRDPQLPYDTGPDAYTWRPPRAVPRPYGGRGSDPWGRAWCDCGEPLELHAHIPGSVTGAWYYAPKDVRRPGDRLHRALVVLALLAIGAALGLFLLYAIAAGMVLNALSG